MKILVIGSGLIGAITAYFLSCRGHTVMVVDRQAGPGAGDQLREWSLALPEHA
jgi:glycine/D-amino acid oxidase-like deaminating enzyme